MKKINRNNPPQEFLDLVNGPARPHNWDEFVRDYSDLYHALRNQLLAEQHDTSGYTEKHLDANGNIHIDHFRRKGIFGAAVTFDNTNMVVDERDCRLYGAGFKDARVTKEDYQWLIDPISENPDDFFTYMADGTMIPRRDIEAEKAKRAKFTIDMFNLNHPHLRNKRRDLMMMLEVYKQSAMSKEDATIGFQSIGFFTLIDYVYG